MNATLEATTQVALAPRTTTGRERVEELLGEAAYVLQLTRRVRGDILRNAVLPLRDSKSAPEVG